MSETLTALPRDRALDPPLSEGKDGPRRIGVEIEFGGIGEERAAEIVRDLLGGRIEPDGDYGYVVTGGRIGDVKVYLDTAFRDAKKGTLVRAGVDLGKPLIPVEVVTDPLLPSQLDTVDQLVATLREAGAEGTRQGILLGFGLHLNPELPADRDGAVATVRAFALMEDWLRNEDPMDLSRRVLPFVAPYPRSFVDRIAQDGGDWDFDRFAAAYLKASPTRDRGLDMLPAIRALRPELFESHMGEAPSVSARPTFHYRLPDCRIDEPDWSVSYEWNRWLLVERLAADRDALEALAGDWLAHRKDPLSLRGDWRERVDAALGRLPQ